MAYNPALYNPYGIPQQTQPQPVNGLVFIDRKSIDSYQMPPGSVSPPLFVDDSHFAIKTFDSNGGSMVEWFEATKINMSEPSDTIITKADLDAFEAKIMEAINGKHSGTAVSATPATEL